MISWQYLAGFTDGEGCIYYGGHGQCVVTWSQAEKNIAALDAVEEFLDSNGIKFSWYTRTYHGNPSCIVTVCSQESALLCLKSMLPYLVLKKQRALDAIEHIEGKQLVAQHRKEFCKNGHRRTVKNTYVGKNIRYCRVCKRETQKRSYERIG